MNWLQRLHKQAGISFFIAGSEKISQPKTILQLAHDMADFAAPKIGMKYQDIDSDGDDYDKYEGTINWYVKKGVPVEDQWAVIKQWTSEMEITDYKFAFRGPEVSGLSHDPDNPLYVIRIDVLQNGSKNYTKMPEMHLSEVNAIEILRNLGINPTYSGEINIDELETKLEGFTEWDHQNMEVEPSRDNNVIEMGRSYEQIGRQLNGFRQLIQFARKNGFNTIFWG